MGAESEGAGSSKPETENREATLHDIDPAASQIAMRDRELAVDVDSLLTGEFEPLEFAKELDTQFELILDVNKALETDLHQARDELRGLKRRNTQLGKLVRQATAEIKRGKDLDEQLAKARADYEAFLEQTGLVRQDVERHELVIGKKDDKISRLNETRDELTYEIGVLKNKTDGVRAEKAEFDNQLQTVHFDLRDLEDQKRAAEGTIQSVRLRIKATQENVLKIKRTLSNVLTAFANTHNKARLQFSRIKSVRK
jgi:chromosome segregation ATPase